MSDTRNIKQRVMLLADRLGLGHRQIAEQIGMTYSNFTGKAKETPLNSTAVANILAMHPVVNAHWLLTGEGEMLKNAEEMKKNAAAAYPLPEKKSIMASDYRGNYEIVAQSPAGEVPQWLIDEHRIHSETVLSQQRTIEKLVDIVNK